MNISSVGSPVFHAPAGPPRPVSAAARPQVAAAGTDADGDNDGSKGGQVDVRA